MAARATLPEERGVSPANGRGPLYPRIYVWFFFLAGLDLLLTYMVLSPLFGDRGQEVNAVAEWVLDRFGFPGMAVYKFSLVLFVVFICEIVGRHNDRTGRRLAEWSVAITAIPVAVSFAIMLVDVYGLIQPIPDHEAFP